VITVELYPAAAPNTVANSIELANSSFYDGLMFHRVIKGFMIQGGDPKGDGTGGPDYAIKGEFTENGVDNRLTHTPGYDGGPFFTHDGTRIVWRRFSTDAPVADIYTMKTDGTDVKRVTDFGAMSWAPYEHPSGQYIIFASNKLGHANFELFIVDPEGTKEPVRVTYTDGFDGLPVPSPDGKRLAWTSSRSGAGAGQIFIADWNHEKALEALRNAPARQSAKR
jgi:cyclophilin family peptidyl-prolyl cis-trans isomerase